MGQPARRRSAGRQRTATRPVEEPPALDSSAVDRAYRQHRAKRRARVEHRRRARWASVRFWVVLWILLVLCVIAALTIWAQIQQLFGL